jgi:LysW-gamma-L-lysine carboxypeptidase
MEDKNWMATVPPTLFDLVNHYSPSGEESKVGKVLVARLKSLGYDRAFIDEVGNAVGVMGSGERQLVLLGHMDTVPGEIPVRLEGDLLYGRGAVDAKGALAAFVDAVGDLGSTPGWQLVVIGGVDEERTSRGARFVVGEYRPEFAIIGEPSGWDRVTLGYKGYAGVQVTVRRPTAHDAAQAENVNEALVRSWLAIQEQAVMANQTSSRPFDQITPSLTALTSGSDGFENWARMKVVARLPVRTAPEAWIKGLSAVVGDAEVVSLGNTVPPFLADKNTPLVRALLRGIRSAGGDPRFVLKTGTADLNLVAPVWGCSAVAYGPGDSTLDHTPREHISLAEYNKAVSILTDVLREITAA